MRTLQGGGTVLSQVPPEVFECHCAVVAYGALEHLGGPCTSATDHALCNNMALIVGVDFINDNILDFIALPLTLLPWRYVC